MVKKFQNMHEKTYTIGRDQKKSIKIDKSGIFVINLTDPGAEAEVSGAFMAENHDNLEVTVIVHHSAPNTRAETKLHGVARDQAKIKFTGRILIDENCGNINSFLTERVLLLSDQAKAECIPDLEIESDDVKCSHAASISRIPEEQIFYLMSRGISQKAAEDLIVEGFLETQS